jgi:hypothetical protein
MKFFTRDLYESIQTKDVIEGGRAHRAWKSARKAYRKQFRSIQAKLPVSMRGFLDEVCLHDGWIESVRKLRGASWQLEVDGSNGFDAMKWFCLTFSGVKEFHCSRDLIGDCWLYEEVDLHPKAAFEFRVLLEHSELRVVADEVRLESWPTRPA